MGQAGASPAPPARSGWRTVFSDSFSGPAGSAPSSANWLYDTGDSGWGNGETEDYTSSTGNIYLDGSGDLVIRPVHANGQWTSGRIETRQDNFTAPAGGELEMTASLEQPGPANGVGYWPAFWALGSGIRSGGSWPGTGELDMMEDVNALGEVSQTMHCGTDPGGPCNEGDGLGSGLGPCPGCQTGFHSYSVVVDRRNTSAEQVRFYVDGRLNYTVDESRVGTATWQAAIDHGFFILLNVAMGGAYPNGVCGCTSPTSSTTSGAGMKVKYVAVYETGGNSGTTTTTARGRTTTAVSSTTTVPSSAPRVVALTSRAMVTGGRAELELGCSRATCRGKITLTFHKILLGSRRYTLGAGKAAAFPVRLDRKAAGLLASARHHLLGAAQEVTVTGGKAVSKRVELVG
jgi:beta-glucanase (GH16 family)